MSVRRLSQNQPASFEFAPATLKEAKRWMANFPEGRQQSAVIAILWLVQKQEGWVWVHLLLTHLHRSVADQM